MAAIKTFFVPNNLLDRYVADGSKDHTKLFRGRTGMVYDIAAFCDADNNHNCQDTLGGDTGRGWDVR